MSLFSLNFDWLHPDTWGQAIWDAFKNAIQNILSFLDQYVFQPIVKALKDFFQWAWTQIQSIFNAVVQAIMNFVYSWIVNPILSFFQMIFNRIVEKLKGVIYITIVTPLLISEAKDFLHEPTLEKGAKMLIKPFLGYFITEIIYNILYPHTRPVTITPRLPPSTPTLPSLGEVSSLMNELVSVSDVVSTELIGPLEIAPSDIVSVSDSVIAQILAPLEFAQYDTINVSDSVVSSLETPIGISDTITVSDSVTATIMLASYAGVSVLGGAKNMSDYAGVSVLGGVNNMSDYVGVVVVQGSLITEIDIVLSDSVGVDDSCVSEII